MKRSAVVAYIGDEIEEFAAAVAAKARAECDAAACQTSRDYAKAREAAARATAACTALIAAITRLTH